MDEELEHSGVKGMKWGVRKYQDENGNLTRLGKIRYEVDANGRMSNYGQKMYDRHNRILNSNNPEKMTHFEKKYQNEYEKARAQGMDARTADHVAKGKVKTEQTMLAIGGATLATIAVIGTTAGVINFKKKHQINDAALDIPVQPKQEVKQLPPPQPASTTKKVYKPRGPRQPSQPYNGPSTSILNAITNRFDAKTRKKYGGK